MKLDRRITERLERLIEKGNKSLQTFCDRQGEMGYTYDEGLYSEWSNQALVCLIQVFGDNHAYVEGFKSKTIDDSWIYPSDVEGGLGILRAAQEDYKEGYLDDIKNLVAAEFITDLLDQAEHLVEAEYFAAAASLGGAVLENGLRHLANSNKIAVNHRDSLSSLNRKLADNRIYNRIYKQKIEVWTSVRNKAAHGEFDEFNDSDVGDLVEGVREFFDKML